MIRLALFIFIVLAAHALAQTPPSTHRPNERNDLSRRMQSGQQAPDVKSVFDDVERDLSSGNIRSMLGNIGQQVYIDIAGGERGYFSSNQAASLLQAYFAQRRPLSFSFSSVNQIAPSPFATGRFTYVYRGTKESVQVYVALTRSKSGWVITHVNIY